MPVTQTKHVSRAMRVERVALSELRADPENARAHGKKNLEVLKASLSEFGQQKPIVVAADGLVVAGNATLEAAKDLGWEALDVVRTDLTGAAARAYAIADNQTALLAEWDEDALAKAVRDIREQEESLLGALGFDEREIQKYIDQLASETAGLTDPDTVPEPPDDPVTQPGDIWVLGDHRLMCGDSADSAAVDRLLASGGGATVHLVNTDPPYNVRVEPRSNNAIAAGNSSFKSTGKRQTHHQKLDLARNPEKSKPTHNRMRAKDRPLENDFVTAEQFDALLDAWFGNIARVLAPGRAFYLWGGYSNCGNYPPVLNRHGLYFSQAIIWVKGHPVMTRKDFLGDHEWCFYGWKEGARHVFLGPRNVTDVWSVKKVSPQTMVHLTEKPAELAARAIRYSSRQNENVLDLFGGSGSTLIACEQAQRRAFLMELDPPYCDVIVQRWEKFTGGKAKRVKARRNRAAAEKAPTTPRKRAEA